MTALLDPALANLLSPPILCFLLGIGAGAVRADLEIPDAIAKGLALYLIFAIGFKGGVALREAGLDATLVPAVLVAVSVSFAIPALAYRLLRWTTALGRTDAAAIGAHYGSVSIVTYIAAAQFLRDAALPHEPWMPAIVAVMETPAILTGLLLAQREAGKDDRRRRGELLHEVLLNGSVVLLLGAFAIGAITGQSGFARVAPMLDAPFQGVLCFFLLDMGLLVARRFAGFATLGPRLVAFGVYMPLISASIGLALAPLIGLGTGGTALFATLCASASYIAVPAAMRLALPRADPSLSLSLALGVTFPFNIVVGIPLYRALAERIAGG